MKLAFFLGFKLFHKNFRACLSTIIIIAFSICIPILSVNLIYFFQEGIKEKHMQKDFHIQIDLYSNLFNLFKYKIKDSPFFKKTISSAFQFKEDTALIQYQQSEYYPIFLRAFEPFFYIKEKDRLNKHFPLIIGKWNLQKKFEIIIGDTLFRKIAPNKQLQEKLLQDLSDKKSFLVNLFYLPSENEEKNDLSLPLRIFKLKVVGIFSSSYEDYDNIICSHLSTANILFKTKNFIPLTKLGFFLKDTNKLSLVKEELRKIFYPLFIEIDDWEKKNDHLMKSFEWERQILSIVLFIMFISSIIITLYIHLNLFFFKKRYSFGILKAIGIPYKKIRNILFILGMLISFISLIVGNIFCILFLKSLPIWEFLIRFIFYYFSSYPNQMDQTLNMLNSNNLHLEIFLSVNIVSTITLLFSLFFYTRKISKQKIINNLNTE